MKYQDQINKVKNYTGGKEFGAANALGDFAVLLGMLAEDADKQAEENIQIQKDVRDLTKKLRIYTIWLIILTVIMLFVGFAQIYLGFVQRDLAIKSLEVSSQVSIQSDQPNQGNGAQNHNNQSAPK